MKYLLKRYNSRLNNEISLESSKSESNRALIINALACGERKDIHNISNARDTQTMLRLLSEQIEIYDVKDAGTTMRFLTAYLSLKKNKCIITGTDRMKQRPIGPLANSLRKLGVVIDYVEKEGYPPLKISQLTSQLTNEISLPGNISSQYISALLMIAPCLPNGLTIELTTEIYSKPYIQMTLDLMKAFGVSSEWIEKKIRVDSQAYKPTSYTIEGDWSGASYWYSLVALSDDDSLKLLSVRNESKQGDREIASIMEKMGVQSHFEKDGVRITKTKNPNDEIDLDFRNCPDLAQTVMVTAAALGVTLKMTGLESLRIKETDRISAMQTELEKIGATLIEEGAKWTLIPSKKIPESVEIETYEDHRMAMAFASLCHVMDVIIDDPFVVAKSYPSFWDELKHLGVVIEQYESL